MAYLVVFCPRCEETKAVYEGLIFNFEGWVLGEELWQVDSAMLSLGYCDCGAPLTGEVHKNGEEKILV